MIQSIGSELKCLLTDTYNGSDHALVKPFRWCRWNITHLLDLRAPNRLGKVAELIKRVAMGVFSMGALTTTFPLALLGTTLKLISGKKEVVAVNPLDIDHRAIALNELKTKSDEELDRNWNLNDYFGHIRLLNLDKDTERLQECTRSLNEVGCHEFERFSAILGKNLPESQWKRMESNFLNHDVNTEEGRKKLDKQHQGQTGCYMSHRGMIQEAKNRWEQAKGDAAHIQTEIVDLKSRSANGTAGLQNELNAAEARLQEAQGRVKKYSSVLIVEDDNRFGRVLGDPKERNYTVEKVGKVFRRVMAELPSDYDMFFMTSFALEKRNVHQCKWIQKFDYGYDLNAVAIHSRFYDTILDKLKKIDEEKVPLRPVDVEYADLMEKGKVFVASPPIAFQGGFVSNLTQVEQAEPFKQWSMGEWWNIEQKLLQPCTTN